MFADSQTFWQGILQVGLIDDFFREIKYGLDALKHELIRSRGAVDGELCHRLCVSICPDFYHMKGKEGSMNGSQ